MKKIFFVLSFALLTFFCATGQEYATFELTGVHQGTGNFDNAALSDFTWEVVGTLTGEVEILDDEVFDDGNAFESTFGQADNEQNLRIQVIMNGSGTIGQPLTSRASLTLYFDQLTPPDLWGFCVVDIDVENCLISALDENDNEVPVEIIDNWLVELFDANINEDGTNIPKWDPSHAALLGSDTPASYVVYDSLVIGDMPSSEAPAAYFKPGIPIKSLTVVIENLQDVYNTSYHFYIASLQATSIDDPDHAGIQIYPNPGRGIYNLQFTVYDLGSVSVEVVDLYGKALRTWNLEPGTLELWNTETLELDISHLPSGIYFIRIHIENQSIVKKVIKL